MIAETGVDGEEATERLFSYGTLQDAGVQLDVFGRRLSTAPDALVGYRLRMIRIADRAFVEQSGSEIHRTLERTGDESGRVEGHVLRLTAAELATADAYEPDGYLRQRVTLASGVRAWLYVSASG